MSRVSSRHANGRPGTRRIPDFAMEDQFRGKHVVHPVQAWTLQELLAPRSVRFYSSDGMRLVDRLDLREERQKATLIPLEVIDDPLRRSKFSIKDRVSWARHRDTSRPEDRTYCLAGLCDVIVGTEYGEGPERAMASDESSSLRSSNSQPLAETDL